MSTNKRKTWLVENLNQTKVGHLILYEYLWEWICSDSLGKMSLYNTWFLHKTMSADTWSLKLLLALHTMGSATTDTESRLHYAVLHKGLEHLQILVSTGVQKPIPC